MPAPIFSLATTGANPKATTRQILEAEVNRVVGITFDQANPEDRVAAAASAATATEQAGIATADATQAGVYRDQAQVAALAAGAPLVTSLTDPVPANGTVEILQSGSGAQVWQVVTGAWSLVGWLTTPNFATIAAMTLATALLDGQIIEVNEGFNGESETFTYEATSTLAADGALVVDATGMGVGQLISQRTVYADFAEFDADVRTLAAGTSVSAIALSTYEIVASYPYFITTGGTSVKVIPTPNGELPSAAFGVSETNTGAQNSAALQAAVNAAIANGIGTVTLPSGRLVFGTQIKVEAPSGVSTSLDLVGPGVQECQVVSTVTGAALGRNAAGYLFLIDGLRHINWRGFTIDYSAGNGGIIGRCRKQSFYRNSFNLIRFVGGTAATGREVNDRRSIKVVGQEPEGESTGYVSYFTRVDDCAFDIAYTHFEAVDGASGNSLSQPNACFVGDGNLFERYIVAINFNDNDECTIGDSWFQQATGVGGINGGVTDCVYANGAYLTLRYKTESGANARPYALGPNADRVMIDIMSNNALGGAVDAANTTGRIFEQKNTRIDGLERVNGILARTDLNFFGDGAVSHAGATPRSLRVWRNSGSPDNLRIGYNAGTGTWKVEATGKDLDLRPSSDANDVILADSSWDQSLMRLGGYYFWVDTTGRLRIKFGAPASESDGAVVGAQS